MASRCGNPVGLGLFALLSLLLFAGPAAATVINPGFELVGTGTSLQNWGFSAGGPFSGGVDDEFVTEGIRNGRIFSQCAFRSPCAAVTQNQFGSLTQTVDFTGIESLVVDVQLRQGGGSSSVTRWDNKFTATILIDDTPIWSANTATTLNNLQLALTGLTGLHELTFALFARVDVATPSGSNHFNFDNLRVVGNPVPEPGTAALTLVGLLLLGARRQRRAR
jgi:hypothetical protein